jgi:hypothetical protein
MIDPVVEPSLKGENALKLRSIKEPEDFWLSSQLMVGDYALFPIYF